MHTLAVFLWLMLLLLTEAANDGFVHRYKTTGKKGWGFAHHFAQLVLIFTAALAGALFVKFYGDYGATWPQVIVGVWNVKMLWILITYLMLRLGLFDLIYNAIAGHAPNTIGTTDLWDTILRWILLQIANSITWVVRKCGAKTFDARFVLMFHNILKILTAFFAIILIDYKVNG